MTSGALMTLVAYGAQDVYLTGNPQITYFKMVYRRHTNFALETIDLTLSGTAQYGQRSMVTITRNGDLIANMYVRVTLGGILPSAGSKMGYVRRLGHVLLKEVEVEIGGSRIDRQFGVWLDIWYELAHHAGDGERGYNKLIGDVEELTRYDCNVKCEYTLYIPLQFWFNRHYGLALPLIALQYHEVKIYFTFAQASEVIVANSQFKSTDLKQVTLKEVSLFVKYIFLDSEERRRFAQVGHEYLIEQLQFTNEESITSNTGSYKLDFNHPTKELIWAVRNGNYSSGKAFPFYTNRDDWEPFLEEAAKKILSESVLVAPGCCRAPTCSPCDETPPVGRGINATGYGTKRSTRNGETKRATGFANADSNLNVCGDQEAEGDCDYDPNDCIPTNLPREILECGSPSEWEAFGPTAGKTVCTLNGNINVTNNSSRTILWINTNSLSVKPEFARNSAAVAAGSLTGKICADITLERFGCCTKNQEANGTSGCSTNGCGKGKLPRADQTQICCPSNNPNVVDVADVEEDVQILICNVSTSLTVRDLSFPTEALRDCRYAPDDPLVNQLNYGVLIDHTVNPVATSLLLVNGHEREQIRDGNYTNYLQPDQHHTNTPADGINVYSFALSPEEHQPSGTTNFSRIDNTKLNLTFKDFSKCGETLPDLPLFVSPFNSNHKLYIFAFSYNVLRIMSGFFFQALKNSLPTVCGYLLDAPVSLPQPIMSNGL